MKKESDERDTAFLNNEMSSRNETSLAPNHYTKRSNGHHYEPIEFDKDEKDGEFNIVTEPELYEEILKKTTGSSYKGFNFPLLVQATVASCADDNNEIKTINSVCAAMLGIRPKDELEGMLAAQMITVHNQAMNCFYKANDLQKYPELAHKYQNQGNKLVRTFSMIVETLTKHRRKGLQRVKVEHVHVYKGGQAIVGNVQPGGEGEDGTKK
jgi:hypothetical protein